MAISIVLVLFPDKSNLFSLIFPLNVLFSRMLMLFASCPVSSLNVSISVVLILFPDSSISYSPISLLNVSISIVLILFPDISNVHN